MDKIDEEVGRQEIGKSNLSENDGRKVRHKSTNSRHKKEIKIQTVPDI